MSAGVMDYFGASATRAVTVGYASCFASRWPRAAEWAMGLIVISLFTEPFCLANYPSAFHSVMFNPVEPRLLATANSKEGVGLWDIRKPQRWVPFIHMVLKSPPPQLSGNVIGQQVLSKPVWLLISVGCLLTYTGTCEARGALSPRDRQCERCTLLAKGVINHNLTLDKTIKGK